MTERILPYICTLAELREFIESQAELLDLEIEHIQAMTETRQAFASDPSFNPSPGCMDWTNRRLLLLQQLSAQGRDEATADSWLRVTANMLSQMPPQLAKFIELDIPAGTYRLTCKATVIE